MSCAIRSGRERWITAVVHLEDDGVLLVTKPQRAVTILQSISVGERAEHIGERIDREKIRPICRHDQKAARLKDCIGGKGVVDCAGDSPAADLLEPGLRIINLDKLEVLSIHSISRMI